MSTPPPTEELVRQAASPRFGVLARVLRLIVSVGILSWLAWRINWHQIQHVFTHLHFEWWLGAVAVCLLMQVISGLRWQLLAQPLGFQGSLGRFTGFYFIGMFFNLLLPTSVGGDVVRAWYLNGSTGRRMAAFMSVVVDRASGLLILLMVACVGVAICPIPLERWVTLSVWGLAGGAVVGLVLLPSLLHWTARFDPGRQLAEGARFYRRHPRLIANATILSVGVQAGNVIMVWLLGLAISAQVPLVYYWILVPMVSLLTLLPVSVNGMGIREGSTVLFLAPLGVGEDTGFLLAILWFSVLTVVSLCGGAVYFFGTFARPNVQHETV